MKYGEIYSMNTGRGDGHILMCGDATNPEDVSMLIGSNKVDLVLTDPPYGNRDVQHKDGAIGQSKPIQGSSCITCARKYPLMIGNDDTLSARKHYEIASRLTDRLIIWGGHYYSEFLPPSRGWLFWYKNNGTTDFGDGELAWTSMGTKIRNYAFTWNGCFRAGSYKLNPRPRVHPTQKPVELFMKILEEFSQPEEVILDCFGGSGTTLIACEQIGRRCLMMEISPEYCQIIIDRWNKLMPMFEAKRIA